MGHRFSGAPSVGLQPALGGTVWICCHKAESSLGFCRLGRVQIPICFLIYLRNKNQFGNVCFSNEAFALSARCVGGGWLGGWLHLSSFLSRSPHISQGLLWLVLSSRPLSRRLWEFRRRASVLAFLRRRRLRPFYAQDSTQCIYHQVLHAVREDAGFECEMK